MDSIGELPLSSLRTPRSMAHFSLATNATQIDDDDDDDVGRPGTIPEENGGFPWENVGFSWEKHGKKMEKHGKTWEKHGKTWQKWGFDGGFNGIDRKKPNTCL